MAITTPGHSGPASYTCRDLRPKLSLPGRKTHRLSTLGLVPNDTDISVGVMQKLGVPPEKMVILPFPGGTTSTFDEAVLVKQYIEANQVHRIILVTSAFHTRRARWIFQKTFAGLPVTLEMAAAPHIGFDQTDWWKNETGLITLTNEYIKLVYYFFKYH